MIVERWTFYVKSAMSGEAVKHCEEGMKTVWPPSSRFYTPMFAPFGTFVVDFEFENLAALEKFWEKAAETGFGEWGEKWHAMHVEDKPGSREVWHIGGS
jgi:hypothetical protein